MASPQEATSTFGVNILEGGTPEEEGLAGWLPFGSRTTLSAHHDDPYSGARVHGPASSGRYVLATCRANQKDGMYRAVPAGTLVPRVTYRVAGWIRLGGTSSPEGSHAVRVRMRADEFCWVDCGAAPAEVGRWVQFKGSFRLKDKPSVAEFYVRGAPPGVDVMVMDLKIFATDRKARLRQLKEKTDKVRKRDVVLKFGGEGARAAGAASSMSGASVRVVQMDNSFPFGSCINGSVIHDPNFVDFFTNNFDWAVFENELKWYWTESQQGQLNYRDADALLDFCDRHGKRVRGHCIFWAVDGDVQPWLKSLSPDQLVSAVRGRLHGLLGRYAGRFPHYDVNNEMLHGHFFRDRLGDGAAAFMFREAARLDPAAALFVNDYNVECGNDPRATPEAYVEQVGALRRAGAAVGGIGLQGHVSNPVGEVICDALDKLAATGLPVWLTELDVCEPDVALRADDLEVVLREVYAHPAVEGVVLWGFMQGHMWRQDASLVDADGAANEAGQRFIDLRREWTSDARGHVDGDGCFRFRGYHGTYVAQVTTATGKKILKTFTVDKGDSALVLDM